MYSFQAIKPSLELIKVQCKGPKQSKDRSVMALDPCLYDTVVNNYGCLNIEYSINCRSNKWPTGAKCSPTLLHVTLYDRANYQLKRKIPKMSKTSNTK